MKLTLSLILQAFSTKMLWTQIKDLFCTSHPQILTFHSICWSSWQVRSPKSKTNLSLNLTTVSLERHEQRHPQIHTYCALCQREKARTQKYPLQMTNIPNRPFDKIAIDLVTDLNVYTSGNQHILTIIGHLTGRQEDFQFLTRKQIPLFVFWSIIIYLSTCALI